MTGNDSNRFNQHLAVSLLTMAGFKVGRVKELFNQYSRTYDDPWFLIQTEFGVIIIGWRKRVIEIEWSFCEFRGIITQDEVTKFDYLVHAWTYEKALQYLTELYKKMLAAKEA